MAWLCAASEGRKERQCFSREDSGTHKGKAVSYLAVVPNHNIPNRPHVDKNHVGHHRPADRPQTISDTDN